MVAVPPAIFTTVPVTIAPIVMELAAAPDWNRVPAAVLVIAIAAVPAPDLRGVPIAADVIAIAADPAPNSGEVAEVVKTRFADAPICASRKPDAAPDMASPEPADAENVSFAAAVVAIAMDAAAAPRRIARPSAAAAIAMKDWYAVPGAALAFIAMLADAPTFIEC